MLSAKAGVLQKKATAPKTKTRQIPRNMRPRNLADKLTSWIAQSPCQNRARILPRSTELKYSLSTTYKKPLSLDSLANATWNIIGKIFAQFWTSSCEDHMLTDFACAASKRNGTKSPGTGPLQGPIPGVNLPATISNHLARISTLVWLSSAFSST